MKKYVFQFLDRVKKHKFIFEELVKRDFKQKYSRTVLGMLWSILNPLLTLLVMRLVFGNFFGRNTPYYSTYVFSGTIIFSFFKEATTGGMNALVGNAGIITKVPVPKYLFVLSKSISAIINFGLTLIVFLIFALLDSVKITWKFLFLVYPIFTLILFSLGVGMTLSALFVYFRDIRYLYDIFTMLLMYLSAIFYQVESFSPSVQRLFLLNPIYVHIRYFRKIVIDSVIPSLQFHAALLIYAIVFLALGAIIYKSMSKKILYYL